MYVPLEAVASKWYGESEGNLAKIFKAAEDLGGAILFLDEIDSLATERRRAPALMGVLGPAGPGRRHPVFGRDRQPAHQGRRALVQCTHACSFTLTMSEAKLRLQRHINSLIPANTVWPVLLASHL